MMGSGYLPENDWTESANIDEFSSYMEGGGFLTPSDENIRKTIYAIYFYLFHRRGEINKSYPGSLSFINPRTEKEIVSQFILRIDSPMTTVEQILNEIKAMRHEIYKLIENYSIQYDANLTPAKRERHIGQISSSLKYLNEIRVGLVFLNGIISALEKFVNALQIEAQGVKLNSEKTSEKYTIMKYIKNKNAMEDTMIQLTRLMKNTRFIANLIESLKIKPLINLPRPPKTDPKRGGGRAFTVVFLLASIILLIIAIVYIISVALKVVRHANSKHHNVV